MARRDGGLPAAKRTCTLLEVWHNGRGPNDGPPDEVVEQVVWHDLHGGDITDPAIVAALEAARDAGDEQRIAELRRRATPPTERT